MDEIEVKRPHGLSKAVWDAMIQELETWDRRFDCPETILENLLFLLEVDPKSRGASP